VQGNINGKKCPLCRTERYSSREEQKDQLRKRVEVDDVIAIYELGCDYRDGVNGFAKDYKKALELCHRAGELVYAAAYNGIGYAYEYGRGVEVDMKKAIHYYEVAAMQGDEEARCNLGKIERRKGIMDRALKHYMIAVSSGDIDSLKTIKDMYSGGHATKDDYTKAFQTYQTYLGEIKSDKRDKAAAAREDHHYY